MREFAQTYVQLANQAADLPAEDQLRLKRAHDLAQVMVDGMYRAQSTPFLCHLVRTASICLAERQPRVVVEAALLHATYLLHRFRNTRRHGLAARHAARLRRVVGEEVEALVRTYGALPFDSPEDVARHSAGLAAASPSTRQALVIALANELEDHLDGAMLYGGPARAPDALQARALECSLLAERLDLPVLAGELLAPIAFGRDAVPHARQDLLVLPPLRQLQVSDLRAVEVEARRRHARTQWKCLRQRPRPT